MPQPLPTRATLRRAQQRRRRTPRVHAATTGLAAITAAALTVTAAVPPATPTAKNAAQRADATPVAQHGTAASAKAATANAATAKAAKSKAAKSKAAKPTAVETALEQASGALVAAQHVAMEGVDVTPAQAEKINHATEVVRELVRRAAQEADAEVPAVAETSVPAESPLAPELAVETPGSSPAFDAASVPGSDTTVLKDGDAIAVDLSTTTPSEDVAKAADAAVKAAAKAKQDAAAKAAAEKKAAAQAAVKAATAKAPKAQDAVVAAEAKSAAAKKAADATHPTAVVATALQQQSAQLAKMVNRPATVSVDPAPTPEEIAAAKAKAKAAAAAKAKAKAAAEAARIADLSARAAQFGNGQIPGDLLVGLSWTGHAIRADAASQLEKLNKAFQATFGVPLKINDGYRSYGDQVATKRSRGKWAAVPGYSNHGLAVAVDVGDLAYGNAMYQWLDANGPGYGWVNPDWARAGGRKPEPWHWEFVGA